MVGFAQETFWGAHPPRPAGAGFAAPRRELSVAIRRLMRRILSIDWQGANRSPEMNANLRLSKLE